MIFKGIQLLQRHRRRLIVAGIFILMLIGLVLGVAAIYSPQLTSYIQGPKFRAELDKQTSKGLHFRGRFEPIRRTGFATVETPGFEAGDGVKAIKSLQARNVTGRYNPAGLLLRRWQLDYVHIKSGEVEVQTYKPKPEQKPPKPWYSIFLPDRVYLCEVTCETTNVKWRLRDTDAGIFGTRLLITPHGRDFEYRAEGGELRNAGLTPELGVKAIHLLITKEILKVYKLELFQDGGSIRVTGDAGMKTDKHVAGDLEVTDLPLAPWLPAELQRQVRGRVSGNVHWRGTDQKLETSFGDGELRVADGKLMDIPLLDYLAAATKRKSLKSVMLTDCVLKFRWKYPRFEISSIDLRGEDKFALRGSLTVKSGGTLSGKLELGMALQYLDWLPQAREIFTRENSGLLWTTVRLFGTISQPENDLAPRIVEALKADPTAAVGLFFRGVSEWLKQKSQGDRLD